MKKPDHWLVEHVTKTVTGNAAWFVVLGILGLLGVGLYAFGGWLSETVEIYRWHYWLLPFIGFTSGVLLSIVLVRMADKAPLAPSMRHTEYTEDQFFGIRWRWLWDSRGYLDSDTIIGYCPSCSRRLIYASQYDDSTVFHCQGCDQKRAVQGAMPMIQEKVAIEIEHKLRQEREHKVKQ